MLAFKKLLTEEPVPVSPQDQEYSPDESAWRTNNKDIVDNEELSGRFDVEGMSVDMGEKYTEKIQQWRNDISQMENMMESIHKFAADKADQPGSGELYSSIGSLVEGILTDLGTLTGDLRTLGSRVRIAMRRDNEKQSQG